MLGDRVAGAIGGERIDKRFIDLQDIHVKRVEIMQIGIAGTEVINSNFISGARNARMTGIVFCTSINPRSVTSILI